MRRVFLFAMSGLAIFGFLGTISILFAEAPLVGFFVFLFIGCMGLTYPGLWEKK